MSVTIRFNLKEAREFACENKKDNNLKTELVIDAINSIGKRNEYLLYFYSEFNEVTQECNLALDRVGVFKDKGILLRTKYEALSFAFISNLHEMLDSYPFIYLGIFKDKIKDEKYLDWKNLDYYQSHVAVNRMLELKKTDLFVQLDNMNNAKKHRTLPKVYNEFTHLNVDAAHGHDEEVLNLKDLLRELHNKLIPAYFEILNLTFTKN